MDDDVSKLISGSLLKMDNDKLFQIFQPFLHYFTLYIKTYEI